MQMRSALKLSALGLTLLAVAGCATPRMFEATATERELCIAWRDSLPTRSKSDTEETRAEIGRAYDVQAAACPSWKRFP
jgi:hypothetical protein